MKDQNYSSHRRFVPMYHFVLLPAMLVLLIGSVVNLMHSSEDNLYSASLLVLSSFLLLLAGLFIRFFALKAQDRAIVAEERFRHYVLTNKILPPALSVRQIIGLRFASDEEFPELAEKAARENLSEEDIKKAIKNWKGDFYRV